jgi:hypothetical protein
MKKLNLFDHLENITQHKTDFDIHNDEQERSYNKYMINRFISMCDIYIPFVNEINMYDVPKDVHYNFYKNLIPKRKQYFKYIKGKKELDEDDREKICKFYKCGNKELDHHLRILTEKQIQHILDIYKNI